MEILTQLRSSEREIIISPPFAYLVAGGANDIASSAKRTIIMMRQEKRRFVERVDYITSPGYLGGGDSRKKVGLVGGGPVVVITDQAILRFDKVTKEIYLESVHPGVTVEEAREVGWDLKVAEDVKVTESPSDEDVRLIRMLDPWGIYTGNGLKTITFEQYIKMLEESFVQLDKLYKTRDLLKG